MTRINQVKEEVGYKLEANKILDINSNQVIHHELIINATAFMDDTTLIANNLHNLKRMINICFDINNIRANVTNTKC